MSRYITGATWNDCPHLSEEAKADLWASIPAYQRDARAKGIPVLGAGAIYPIPEEDILCDPFPIPDSWPRGYALDVGWNMTAAQFGAKDPSTGVVYLYSSHYRGQAEPAVHALGIRARGAWIRGRIDPAARQRAQKDGIRMLNQYKAAGLLLDTAVNAVESGIADVYTGLSSGLIKVFRTLTHWRAEYRMYQRDEKGQIKKTKDHLMDSTRYLLAPGTDQQKWWTVRPAGWKDDGTQDAPEVQSRAPYDLGAQGLGWMR